MGSSIEGSHGGAVPQVDAGAGPRAAGSGLAAAPGELAPGAGGLAAGEPRYPEWLCEHVREHRGFIDGLEPFPFAQPSDIRGFLSLHQNDYLRLANHPEVVRARSEANSRRRIESFSSSIFGGASREHDQFTALLKESLQAGDVVLTTAGWTANVGLLEAITRDDMPVYIDVEAHASLADGIRLSRGRRVAVRHNDIQNLEKRVRIHGPGIVCLDALYSTDGTLPDLERAVEVCERHDCTLVLDEAHSFGMFGPRGGGLAAQLGLAQRVHFRTVSLSKALGGHGGVVAASRDMTRSLCTRMRSVLFSSATSSVLAAGHQAALAILMREPERAEHCLAMAELLRSCLHRYGIDTAGSRSQIISIFFKNEDACRFYAELRRLGILTSVFLYPATPLGLSLARFSVYSELQASDVRYVADCTASVLRSMGYLQGDGA
jgi:CAI-1 autoinducer synthase